MVAHGKVVRRTWKWQGKKRVAYQFDIEVDGKRVRRQFGSKQEAKDALDAFRDGIKNPAPPPIGAPAAVRTFGELVEKFLPLRARSRTAPEFDRLARHLLGEFGKEIVLDGIDALRISEYKADRLAVVRNGKPLSPAAIKRP